MIHVQFTSNFVVCSLFIYSLFLIFFVEPGSTDHFPTTGKICDCLNSNVGSDPKIGQSCSNALKKMCLLDTRQSESQKQACWAARELGMVGEKRAPTDKVMKFQYQSIFRQALVQECCM